MTDEAPRKLFHVFISYRVKTEAALAESLCDKLQQHMVQGDTVRVRCFLDKQNLVSGEDWEQGFLNGLHGSMLFVPLISAAGIAPIHTLSEDAQDNVLLEYEMALGLRAKGDLEILPLLVGHVDDSRAYHRFSSWGPFPDHPSITARNNAASNDAGEPPSIASIMAAMFKIQGVFIDPRDLASKVPTILSRLSNYVWPRYRGMWHDLSALGPEEKKTCVQCGGEFVESENGIGACEYEWPSPWGNNRPRGAQARRRARHTAHHHNEFPYTARYEWAVNTVGWRSSAEKWFTAAVDDYASGTTHSATVGIIPSGELGGRMFIALGGITWVGTWSSADIREAERVGWEDIAHFPKPELPQVHPLITLNNADHTEHPVWFCAQWVYADEPFEQEASHAIVGVRIAIMPSWVDQSVEGARPSSWVVYFEDVDGKLVTTGTETEHCNNIAETARAPEIDSALPKPMVLTQGTFLPSRFPQALVANPKARARLAPVRGDLPVSLKLTSDIRGTAGDRGNADTFSIHASVINLSETAKLTLLDGEVKWRPHIPAGDPDGEAAWIVAEQDWPSSGVFLDAWSVGDASDVSRSSGWPAVLPPDAVASAVITLRISSDAKYKASFHRNFDTWVARMGPVDIAVTLESKKGAEAEFVFTYSNPDSTIFTEPPSDALAHMYVDTVDSFSRHNLFVTPGSSSQSRSPTDPDFEVTNVRLPGLSLALSISTLRELVFQSRNSGEPFVLVREHRGSEVVWSIWALVDDASSSVVGLKIQLCSPDSKAVGYYPLPAYGAALESSAAPSSTTSFALDMPAILAELLESTSFAEDGNGSDGASASAAASAASRPPALLFQETPVAGFTTERPLAGASSSTTTSSSSAQDASMAPRVVSATALESRMSNIEATLATILDRVSS